MRRDVVAPAGGKVTFYRASNPAESGLLKPESLRELWPHLGTEETIVVDDAVTLDTLQEEAAGQINWLMLDCLPAAGLLQGGAQLLRQLDLVLVRAAQHLPLELAADQQTLDALLRETGLRCIDTRSERHPAMLQALYVRDMAEVQERARRIGEQQALAQEAWAKEKAELLRAKEVSRQKAQAAEQSKVLAQEQAQKLGEQLRVAQEVWAKEKAELVRANEALNLKAQVAEQGKVQAKEQAQRTGEQVRAAQEAWGREKTELVHATEAWSLKAHAAEQAKVQAQELAQKLVEQLRVAQEAHAKYEVELNRAREEKEERNNVAIKRKKQIEQLEAEKAELEALLAKTAQQLEHARKESEAHAKKVQELTLEGGRSSSPGSFADGSRREADVEDFIQDLGAFFYGKRIVYVDVGACTGDVFLKLMSSKHFRVREAHLFEPNPDNYLRMRQNIAEETVPILHAYDFAVGLDKDAVQFIKGGTMTKVLNKAGHVLADHEDVFTVRSVSLDSQAHVFTDGRINLLKVDVEGAELDVLEGARQLLKDQNIDILYIEAGFNRAGTQQTYFADIDGVLQPLGYRVLRIYEQKEEWMSALPILRRCNFAYMSDKFAQSHPLKLIRDLRQLQQELGVLKAAQPPSS